MDQLIGRRSLLKAGALGAAGLGMSGLFPAWAQNGTHGLVRKEMPTLSGEEIRLHVAEGMFTVDGRAGHAITINGTIPAPLIRLREGQNVRLVVENTLAEDTSIHWHGLIVPFQMDGVPGISFPGIRARSTFTYEFDRAVPDGRRSGHQLSRHPRAIDLHLRVPAPAVGDLLVS